MGSTTILNNQMSAITRTRIQGQCDFLEGADAEGSFVKTNLMGRVVAGLNCLALHAEFFARCITMLSLMAINTVTKFKYEQIKIQREQSYAALRTSVLCFTILFQPEMLQHLKGWLAAQPVKELESQDDVGSLEKVVRAPLSQAKQPARELTLAGFATNSDDSAGSFFTETPIAAPQAPRLMRSHSGHLLSQAVGVPRLQKPSIFEMLAPPIHLYPSEQVRLQAAKISAQQQQKALNDALKLRSRGEIEALLAAALQQAQQQKSGVAKALDYKVRTLSSLQEQGWNVEASCGKGFSVEAATFNKQGDSEIQYLHGSLRVRDHDFVVVGLFEPQTGPRAALYLKEYFVQFLSRKLTELSTHGMSAAEICNACTRASFEMQGDFITRNQNERLHPSLPSFAEDSSSMTAILMGKDEIYILNLGNSKAILSNGGQYVPLTSDAMTAFGGHNSQGAASSICRITRILRSDIKPNSQLFLGSSSVFKIAAGESISALLAGIKPPENPNSFVYGENALYSVIKHAGTQELGDVACVVLGFNQLQGLEEDRSVATPSTPLSSITPVPGSLKSDGGRLSPALLPRSDSTFMSGSALFSAADLAAMGAPQQAAAAPAERSPGLPPRSNSTFMGSALFSSSDLAAMGAHQQAAAAPAESADPSPEMVARPASSLGSEYSLMGGSTGSPISPPSSARSSPVVVARPGSVLGVESSHAQPQVVGGLGAVVINEQYVAAAQGRRAASPVHSTGSWSSLALTDTGDLES